MRVIQMIKQSSVYPNQTSCMGTRHIAVRRLDVQAANQVHSPGFLTDPQTSSGVAHETKVKTVSKQSELAK